LSIDPANIKAIKAKYPYFSDVTTIAKGTYKGIDEDITTTGSLATICVRAELPDTVVYNMIKTLFEKKADIVKVHEKGNTINLKNATDGFSIPIHPGALKYYKEQGAAK
jgi:TRAP transporter TAXI family solute receptor